MNSDRFSLKNRAAIVTGGGTGIGRGIALEFAKAGSDVVVAGLGLEGLEKVADEVRGIGKRALAFEIDVRDPEQIENVVAQTLSEFGKIDILVNNAGANFQSKPEDLSVGGWTAIMDINLKGPFIFCKAVGKEMIKQKSGAIINISSATGRDGSGMMIHYASSKAGLMMFTKSLAMAWAKHNIRVNSIAPGYIWTEGADIMYKDEPEKRKIPPNPGALNRWGKPEEIGLAAVFLASDASSFVTGHTLFADGGTIVPD